MRVDALSHANKVFGRGKVARDLEVGVKGRGQGRSKEVFDGREFGHEVEVLLFVRFHLDAKLERATHSVEHWDVVLGMLLENAHDVLKDVFRDEHR